LTVSAAYQSPNRAYVPAVDQLRAWLAGLIVVYHAWHLL
jgi:peptidoglycan/LPS O-acetylase OafA/YrhL